MFFKFSEKDIILCTLKGEMPLKMHTIIVFFLERNVRPTLPKFSDPLTEHIFSFDHGKGIV